MDEIKKTISNIIKMLRGSSKNTQADWLEERLKEMESSNTSVQAVKDIKSILVGMGSLSDIYLNIYNDSINEQEYNVVFRNMILKLESQLRSL